MSTMQAEFMLVDPNELVIDMPVDESHVSELMETMRENGMIQPVTVWLQGLRIIDGFHRAVSAKRLGWTEMQCVVRDCSEDAFWDARIISAKQHHSIEDRRLVVWMAESWRNSEWYTKRKVKSPLAKEVDDISPDAGALVKLMWEHMVRGKATKKEDTFAKWLEQKSKIWGMSAESATQKILIFSGVFQWGEDRYNPIDVVAQKLDLSFEQRQAVVEAAPPRYELSRYNLEVMKNWVMDEVVTNKEDPVPLDIYHKRANKRAARAAKKRGRENRSTGEPEKEIVIKQTTAEVAKQKEDHRQVLLGYAKGLVNEMVSRLGQISGFYATPEMPEVAAMLTEFILLIESKIKSSFPEYDLESQSNPIIVANIELRRRVREQEDRISSLERALAVKSKVSASVVSLSSADIDRMN